MNHHFPLSNKYYLLPQLVFVYCFQMQLLVGLTILLLQPILLICKIVCRTHIEKPGIMIVFLSSFIDIDVICMDVYFIILIFSVIRIIFRFILKLTSWISTLCGCGRLVLFRSTCLNRHSLYVQSFYNTYISP